MSAYVSLAPYYDSLMPAQVYEAWAACCDRLFRDRKVHTVLDLACGTGTLTWMLAEKGYEAIGTDMSVDMLAAAMSKMGDYAAAERPLFLQQAAQKLDLYGTVQAAVCSMDGMNYLSPDILREAIRRVRLFLEPGGIFLFDIHTPEKLHRIDGQAFVSESERAFCVWNASCPSGSEVCEYEIDLFIRDGKRWRRETEEHREYVHDPEKLCDLLRHSGFASVEIFGGLPLRERTETDERLFFLCEAEK